jgi:murein DD-endopeptidase MepM/ murein hydrolase activator NlpD
LQVNRLIRRFRKGEMSPLVGVGATDAEKGNPDMQASLVERVWAWLHETFPERQVYIRSDGRVQFFTFGPSLQATLAGLSLIFLGWVAFATVNVVFKDRIIAAKDHRYQQMQSAYENRVADLQLSYDELNGALVAAEDKFKATADELQTKQNTIMQFVNRKQQVDSTLSSLSGGASNGTFMPASNNGGSDDVIDRAMSSAPSDGDSGNSELGVMQQPVQPQPRTAKPTKASLLDINGAFGRLAGAIFGQSKPKPQRAAAISPEAFSRHPALRTLMQQTARIEQIGKTETQLMAQTQTEVSTGVDSIEKVMRRAGLSPERFVQQAENAQGVGGPLIPIQQVQIDGLSDVGFRNAYLSASAVLEEMTVLLSVLRRIPLTTPVYGPAFEETSGFGARVDPFTGRYAFHPGLDFAGPWGTPVKSTAPGTVVYAGPRGGYGNMVEIDHGFGIHTRYGHLSAITTHVGAKVNKGAVVGKLGSTGRSTGPHVHYEVWNDNVVRNPRAFIEAGRHVLQ